MLKSTLHTAKHCGKYFMIQNVYRAPCKMELSSGKDKISFSYFLIKCRLKRLGRMKMPVYEKSLIGHYKRLLEYRCRCKRPYPIDIS